MGRLPVSEMNNDQRIFAEDRLVEEARRSLERKRWYERLVVIPTSLGMVTATFGLFGREAFEGFRGMSVRQSEHTEAILAALSISVALISLAAEFYWYRRK